MNSVQLAAEVIRRGNYVDRTGIVASQSYIAPICRQQNTIISATYILKARNLMHINLCSFCRMTFRDLAFLSWSWRQNMTLKRRHISKKITWRHGQEDSDFTALTDKWLIYRNSSDCSFVVNRSGLPNTNLYRTDHFVVIIMAAKLVYFIHMKPLYDP